MPKKALRADRLWCPKELVKQLPIEVIDRAHHFVREEHVMFIPAMRNITGCIQVNLI